MPFRKPILLALVAAAVAGAPLFRASVLGPSAAWAIPTLPPGDPRADSPLPPQDTVVVDPDAEKAIQGGLKWLATKQLPNGSWGGNGEQGSHPAAMTAYVLMAFLSAGNLPGEGEYGKNVTRGMNYLLDCVGPDGFIHATNSGSNMYGHGISAIALSEIYGQTRDPRLKPKLESAIKLITSCQNDQGGWRYTPRKTDGDISVTVLQVVALRAAKNAGIDVPQESINRAKAFIRTCYHAPSGGFTYQPNNNSPGFARTAAGIYSLQVLFNYDAKTDPEKKDADRDAEMIRKGSQYLLKNKSDNQWYTYGLFYAGPAQYMIGGDTWRAWYEDHRKLLLGTSKLKREGDYCYWEPLDGKVGNVYATAVYTAILAMPYHYIPLYQR